MIEKKRFVEKNSMLVKEFEKYILEHPEFANRLPDNALVVMQIDGDEAFNQWARETAPLISSRQYGVISNPKT